MPRDHFLDIETATGCPYGLVRERVALERLILPAALRCVTSGTLNRMPAKNPRVNVVLERPIYDAIGRLAREEGTSLSAKARDLLRDALEMHEDIGLSGIAEERERTFDRSNALDHEAVWRPRRRAKR